MEMQSLGDVSLATGKSVDDLAKVWRDPSFSIANISSSGSANKTVIPKKVAADISMRIVPDQVSRSDIMNETLLDTLDRI